MNNKYAQDMEALIDRLTAERDAVLSQLETITADRDAEKRMKAKARIQRDVQTAKAADLQERLTASDEQIATLESQREAWLRNSQAAERRVEVLEADKRTMSEAYILYTWLRKKCDQPSNDVVVVNMNIGHDWVPVHDLDRDLRTMIDREEP